MQLSHTLTFLSQFSDLLVALSDLVLDVLLIALCATTTLAPTLLIFTFFGQSEGFEIDKLIFEFVELQFGVHVFDLSPEFAHLVLDFLDTFFDLAGDAQEAHLLRLVLVLNRFEFAQHILLLLQSRSQLSLLTLDLIE